MEGAAPRLRRWRSTSVEETREVGRALAGELSPDGVLLVHGDLGAGKTVLIQGLASGLGLRPESVQSPTYTLLAEHHGTGGLLRHFDLYRLAPAEVAAAGFEELLCAEGVKAVEWPERLGFDPPGALRVRIRRAPDGGRDIEEIGPGAAP